MEAIDLSTPVYQMMCDFHIARRRGDVETKLKVVAKLHDYSLGLDEYYEHELVNRLFNAAHIHGWLIAEQQEKLDP